MKTSALKRAEAQYELLRRGVPVFAGGDGSADGGVAVASEDGGVEIRAASTQPSNYPLDPVTVSNDQIRVSTMLNEPTRITRLIRDLTLQRFLLDYLFTSRGGVTGGAVVYDQPTSNDLYADRDFQQVEPGQEFPILTDHEVVPQVAYPEKWGAKVFITDEARDRNRVGRFNNLMRRVANTLVRKLNQRAVETIEAVFTAFPAQIIPGHSWGSVNILGSTPTAYASQPIGDFVAIGLYNENLELGMQHDTLLMHPNQRASLQLIYGQEWRAVLAAYGYNDVYVSLRVTAGTAYSLARGQLGAMHIEAPLATETWRDPDGRQQTWTQTSVRPLMYVDNPFAVVKLTGIA